MAQSRWDVPILEFSYGLGALALEELPRRVVTASATLTLM